MDKNRLKRHKDCVRTVNGEGVNGGYRNPFLSSKASLHVEHVENVISNPAGTDDMDGVFENDSFLVNSDIFNLLEGSGDYFVQNSKREAGDGKSRENDYVSTSSPIICNTTDSSTPKRTRSNVDSKTKSSRVVFKEMLNKSDVSPIPHSMGESISSFIKKKLKQNGSSKLTSNSVVTSLARANSSRQKVMEEAEAISEQMSPSDLGPFFGLPSQMKKLLKSFRGIEELYQWQVECLSLPAVRQKRNLIYMLPTSGGKTLVAEILMLREILCHLKDAILVLPYVSLVQEKVRGLAPFAVEMDFIVEEMAGNKGVIPPKKRRRRHTLYVCTIEKAHMLVNSLIESQRTDEIGILIADEIHMLGEDGGRGAVFECLLSKVLYMFKNTQIVGMSATLGNVNDLLQFLRAELYRNDFRPVELRELVKVHDKLFEFIPGKGINKSPVAVLSFDYTNDMMAKDPDMLCGLVKEVVPKNSCLIFCPTKKHCENVAMMLFHLLPDSLKEHKREEKMALRDALIAEGSGRICSILKDTIKVGVAYHHSGLTMDERKLIEEAYISGTLTCLACTSTLAAGVNLPAKRVILRAPYVAQDFISFNKYKQMAGRAGRAGIDSSGESILMIRPGEEIRIENLLNSDYDTCKSSLLVEPERIQMLLLSLIGLGIATSLTQIHEFIDHTLAAVQCRNSGGTPNMLFLDTVKLLTDWGLVYQTDPDNGVLTITKYGRAAFKGGVEAFKVSDLCNYLRKGLKGLFLNSYLHLLFIITPSDQTDVIKFNSDAFYEQYMALSEEDKIVAEHIGVTENLVMIMASGRALKADSRRLLHHFYLSMILYDLWNQHSIWSVSHKYQVHRGVIQNFLTSASAFGNTLVHFCQELDEFWAFQLLLPDFVKRVSYCSAVELIPLLELPAVKRGRARQLFNAGFKTVGDIARSEPSELVSRISLLPRKVAVQIVSAAKMMLLERAEALQEEAELLIQNFECSVIL